MGILNNVWIALNTPNEVLTNISMALLTFLECFLSTLLFLSIFKIKANRKQIAIYVFLSAVTGIINTYIVPNPFNVLINYTLNVLYVKYIFKLSIIKSVLATFSSALIFGLIGSLFTNPYLAILNITSEQIINVPIYRICYALIMYFFVFLIILIIKYKNFSFTLLEDIDSKTKFSILANVILGITSLIAQAITMFFYIDVLPITISILSFISLLVYFVISIYSLTRIMKLTLTTRKLESAESFNYTLRVLHDNVRGFKHDFDNILTTIGGYIRTEDMEGLKKYYLELEDDSQRVNNLYILNPEIVNNDGIYNLLTKKYNEADSKNIKVNITFLLDIGKIHMKIYEFARILGILLDNAIEESSECDEKIINLTFRNDEKNSRELILIENTYKDKNVDLDKIFEKEVSGKENHTGLGLWEVRKIIKKNNNVNLYTSKNDKYFSQQLEIYY